MGCAVTKDVKSSHHKGRRASTTSTDIKDCMSFCRSKDAKNQKRALATLLELAQKGDLVRHRIIQEGGTSAIIAAFQGKFPESQELVLRLVSELCKSQVCLAAIMDDDTWASMILGLESDRCETREAALSCISVCVESEEAGAKLVLEGLVPGLVNIIEADCKEDLFQCDLKALQLLHKLSQSRENLSRMVEDGVLEPLFHILHSSLKDLQQKVISMQVLADVCRVEDSHELLVQLHGNTGLQRVASLVSFLHEEVALHAAEAVAHLAKNPMLIRPLVRCGVLPPLERMLKSRNGTAARAALTALSALAQSLENQSVMAQGGILRKVLNLLQCGQADIEEAAAELVQQMCANEVNRPRIIAEGGLRALRQAAEDEERPETYREHARLAMGQLVRLFEDKKDRLVPKAAVRFLGKLQHRDDAPPADEANDGPEDVAEDHGSPKETPREGPDCRISDPDGPASSEEGFGSTLQPEEAEGGQPDLSDSNNEPQ